MWLVQKKHGVPIDTGMITKVIHVCVHVHVHACYITSHWVMVTIKNMWFVGYYSLENRHKRWLKKSNIHNHSTPYHMFRCHTDKPTFAQHHSTGTMCTTICTIDYLICDMGPLGYRYNWVQSMTVVRNCYLILELQLIKIKSAA